MSIKDNKLNICSPVFAQSSLPGWQQILSNVCWIRGMGRGTEVYWATVTSLLITVCNLLHTLLLLLCTRTNDELVFLLPSFGWGYWWAYRVWDLVSVNSPGRTRSHRQVRVEPIPFHWGHSPSHRGNVDTARRATLSICCEFIGPGVVYSWQMFCSILS